MLRLFKQYYPVRNAIFVVGEALFIFLSVLIASFLMIGSESFSTDHGLIPKTLLICAVCQLCLYYNDLYDMNVADSFHELFTRLLQALGASAIFLAGVYFLFPICVIGRGIFSISICFVIAFIVLWRLAYTHILNRGLFNKKIILLGNGELSKNIASQIEENKDCGYQVSAVIEGKDAGDGNVAQSFQSICRNGYDELCESARKLNIDKIVVALEERRGCFPVKPLLRCRVNGFEVIEGTSFYEMLTGKLIVEKINPSWLIFSEGFTKSWLKKLFKRSSDIVFSLILLIVLAPLLTAVAILIKLDSKGPIIFSQERVGENKKPYVIYKFRSMMDNAEDQCGPVWAKCDDPRITRVGKFIRKWRIDEFPQIFNVIRGDMSFVGPRPEREFFVKELEKTVPYYSERFSVKPGITGWAQVNYHYGDSVDDAKEKLNYDLFYIKNMSIFMDLMVVMRTVKTMMMGEGAR